MRQRRPARYLRAERTARQILRAARRVFACKGFDAARIGDIASAARLAEGTIYVHFANKQELLRQACAVTANEILTTLDKTALTEAPRSHGRDTDMMASLLETGLTKRRASLCPLDLNRRSVDYRGTSSM